MSEKLCESGTYGPGCNKNCSVYCNTTTDEISPCHHRTGTCISGCLHGYTGAKCETKDQTESPDLTGPECFIGLGIGLGVAVITIVGLFVIYCRRKYLSHQKNRRQRSSVYTEVETTIDKDEQTQLVNLGNMHGERKQPSLPLLNSDLQEQINQLREEKRQMEVYKEQTDSEIATLRAEIGKHEQEEERQRNLFVSQSLEHEKAKEKVETLRKEGQIMATKLEKLKEKKKNLQQDKEKLIEEIAYLKAQLIQNRSTDKTAVFQGQLEEMQKRMTNLEKELKKATSEESRVQEKHEETEKLINIIDKILCTNQVHQDLLEKRTDIKSSYCYVQDKEILTNIRTVFMQRIIPLNVLHFFHKYNTSILTQPDIENVTAVTNNHGKSAGAAELLSYLVRYKDWFPCLLQVLRDPLVKQEHVAKEMEGLCQEQSKTLDAETLPSTGFKAHTICTLRAGNNTNPIKEYDTVEINYGGHFDPVSGHYTVPYNGRYHVRYSTDHQDGCLRLYNEKNKDRKNTIICVNEESPINKGVKEVTSECVLCTGDSLFLRDWSDLGGLDKEVTVRFSASYLG